MPDSKGLREEKWCEIPVAGVELGILGLTRPAFTRGSTHTLDRTSLPGSTRAVEFLTRRTFVHTLCMMEIEWNPKKAEANLREHGISFAEAATVLLDEYALSREDQDSIGEQRFVSLGMSGTGALLVVVYTHREPDIYRLISSWKANKPQRNQYEKGRR